MPDGNVLLHELVGAANGDNCRAVGKAVRICDADLLHPIIIIGYQIADPIVPTTDPGGPLSEPSGRNMRLPARRVFPEAFGIAFRTAANANHGLAYIAVLIR